MAMGELFCRRAERPQKQRKVIECGKNECCRKCAREPTAKLLYQGEAETKRRCKHD